MASKKPISPAVRLASSLTILCIAAWLTTGIHAGNSTQLEAVSMLFMRWHVDVFPHDMRSTSTSVAVDDSASTLLSTLSGYILRVTVTTTSTRYSAFGRAPSSPTCTPDSAAESLRGQNASLGQVPCITVLLGRDSVVTSSTGQVALASAEDSPKGPWLFNLTTTSRPGIVGLRIASKYVRGQPTGMAVDDLYAVARVTSFTSADGRSRLGCTFFGGNASSQNAVSVADDADACGPACASRGGNLNASSSMGASAAPPCATWDLVGSPSDVMLRPESFAVALGRQNNASVLLARSSDGFATSNTLCVPLPAENLLSNSDGVPSISNTQGNTATGTISPEVRESPSLSPPLGQVQGGLSLPCRLLLATSTGAVLQLASPPGACQSSLGSSKGYNGSRSERCVPGSGNDTLGKYDGQSQEPEGKEDVPAASPAWRWSVGLAAAGSEEESEVQAGEVAESPEVPSGSSSTNLSAMGTVAGGQRVILASASWDPRSAASRAMSDVAIAARSRPLSVLLSWGGAGLEGGGGGSDTCCQGNDSYDGVGPDCSGDRSNKRRSRRQSRSTDSNHSSKSSNNSSTSNDSGWGRESGRFQELVGAISGSFQCFVDYYITPALQGGIVLSQGPPQGANRSSLVVRRMWEPMNASDRAKLYPSCAASLNLTAGNATSPIPPMPETTPETTPLASPPGPPLSPGTSGGPSPSLPLASENSSLAQGDRGRPLGDAPTTAPPCFASRSLISSPVAVAAVASAGMAVRTFVLLDLSGGSRADPSAATQGGAATSSAGGSSLLLDASSRVQGRGGASSGEEGMGAGRLMEDAGMSWSAAATVAGNDGGMVTNASSRVMCTLSLSRFVLVSFGGDRSLGGGDWASLGQAALTAGEWDLRFGFPLFLGAHPMAGCVEVAGVIPGSTTTPSGATRLGCGSERRPTRISNLAPNGGKVIANVDDVSSLLGLDVAARLANATDPEGLTDGLPLQGGDPASSCYCLQLSPLSRCSCPLRLTGLLVPPSSGGADVFVWGDELLYSPDSGRSFHVLAPQGCGDGDGACAQDGDNVAADGTGGCGDEVGDGRFYQEEGGAGTPGWTPSASADYGTSRTCGSSDQVPPRFCPRCVACSLDGSFAAVTSQGDLWVGHLATPSALHRVGCGELVAAFGRRSVGQSQGASPQGGCMSGLVTGLFYDIEGQLFAWYRASPCDNGTFAQNGTSTETGTGAEGPADKGLRRDWACGGLVRSDPLNGLVSDAMVTGRRGNGSSSETGGGSSLACDGGAGTDGSGGVVAMNGTGGTPPLAESGMQGYLPPITTSLTGLDVDVFAPWDPEYVREWATLNAAASACDSDNSDSNDNGFEIAWNGTGDGAGHGNTSDSDACCLPSAPAAAASMMTSSAERPAWSTEPQGSLTADGFSLPAQGRVDRAAVLVAWENGADVSDALDVANSVGASLPPTIYLDLGKEYTFWVLLRPRIAVDAMGEDADNPQGAVDDEGCGCQCKLVGDDICYPVGAAAGGNGTVQSRDAGYGGNDAVLASLEGVVGTPWVGPACAGVACPDEYGTCSAAVSPLGCFSLRPAAPCSWCGGRHALAVADAIGVMSLDVSLGTRQQPALAAVDVSVSRWDSRALGAVLFTVRVRDMRRLLSSSGNQDDAPAVELGTGDGSLLGPSGNNDADTGPNADASVPDARSESSAPDLIGSMIEPPRSPSLTSILSVLVNMKLPHSVALSEDTSIPAAVAGAAGPPGGSVAAARVTVGVVAGCPPHLAVQLDLALSRYRGLCDAHSSDIPCSAYEEFFYPAFVVTDLVTGARRNYSSLYRLAVTGAGPSRDAIRPFTLEEVIRFNAGGKQPIWTSLSDALPMGVFSADPANRYQGLGWICSSSSPCGGIRPFPFFSTPDFYLQFTFSSTTPGYGPAPASYCDLRTVFIVRLHTLPPTLGIISGIMLTVLAMNFLLVFSYAVARLVRETAKEREKLEEAKHMSKIMQFQRLISGRHK
eukprot:jgi/Mesvir1/24058/Mv10788-RA.2